MQHAPQLLHLPVGLDRHAAEHDLHVVVVADLRDENVERPRLVAAHRFHVAAVDGECDRLHFGRRSGCRGRHRLALESGADVQGPLADRLHLRGAADREELFEKRTSTTIRQQGAHPGAPSVAISIGNRDVCNPCRR